ncbi:MAG: hypothetical protein V1766_04130 [Pseudomonadota bacterium]
MDTEKDTFLRNEFLTMSIFAALGRSNTYSKSASETSKSLFRNALREKLCEIAWRYNSPITEEWHLSNIAELSDNLTSKFSDCLRNGRFRIGIAQKALNLYLKYLWCAGLIPLPPHCPFDSIVIGHLSGCGDLNWTSIDSNEDYLRLVRAAENIAQSKTLSEWELKVWGESSPAVVRPPRTIVKGRNVEKSPGWEKFASKFHDELDMVMSPYKNNVLKTAKIKSIIQSVPTFKRQEQWIFPSDHCINHTNKGACYCAMTENAIFSQIARGKYRIL